MATDQELNEYMSVKKYAPYRRERGHYNKSTQEKLHDLKAKLGERVGPAFGNAATRGKAPGADHQEGEKVKKRKGKKERMKMKALNGEDGDAVTQDIPPAASKVTGVDEGSKKDKKRKREQDQNPSPTEVANAGEDGETATKKKRKRNRKKHDESEITAKS